MNASDDRLPFEGACAPQAAPVAVCVEMAQTGNEMMARMPSENMMTLWLGPGCKRCTQGPGAGYNSHITLEKFGRWNFIDLLEIFLLSGFFVEGRRTCQQYGNDANIR